MTKKYPSRLYLFSIISILCVGLLFWRIVYASAPEAGGDTTVVSPSDESPVSINEDAVQPESANIRLIVPNIVDPEGGTPSEIRIISVTGGTLWNSGGGSITLGESGTTLSLNTDTIDFRFRPDAGRDTNASFVYAVVDPHNSSIHSSFSTATIPITAINDAPILQTQSGSTGIGLSATYYIEEWDLTGATYQRIDSTVNFSNNFGVPGLNTENFSVRWTGQIKAPVSGDYVFRTWSDDGVRLWVNDELIIDNWTLHGTTLDVSSAVALEADTMYDIRFEFYERGGGEVAILEWQYPGQSAQVIPQGSLFPAVTRPELQYVTGSGAVIIDDAVTINDVDSTMIVSSTIQFTANYQSEEDSLVFTNQNGITGVFSNGALFLTGTATLAQYQAALRSIKYINSSEDPTTSARNIEFIVFDGSDNSNATFRSIGFTNENSPPVITEGASVSVTMDVNGDPTAFSLTLNATDPDYHSISWDVIEQAVHGTATATATGTGDSIAVTYTPTEGYSGEDTFIVEASDGIGGTDTIEVTVIIQEYVAPIITNISAQPSSTTASIRWTTDERASSRLYYGAVSLAHMSASTTETNTDPRVFSHEVDISSLIPCTTYYYLVESSDQWENTATSTSETGSFVTTGCAGSATVSNATTTPVTVASGGSTTLTQETATIEFTIPVNSTSSSDSIVIQVHALDSSQALNAIGNPSAARQKVGPIVFEAKAIINGTTILDSFDAPVTITYTYNDEDIAGLNEATLKLYHYHNDVWNELEDCTIDIEANTISCTTESFSIFGLFGEAVSSNTTNANGGGHAYFPVRMPEATNTSAMGGALQINNGALQTSKQNVTLTISATNTVRMAISEDPEFTTSSFIPFASSFAYVLSNDLGVKTVYVKLQSEDGGVLVVSDTIILISENKEIPKENILTCTIDIYLTTPVKFGENNNADDVRLLEKFLNTYESANVPVNGVYEQADMEAVMKWQEKYASEILHPWGIVKGTGYVYTTSLAKIKKIHELGCARTVVTPTNNVNKTCLQTDTTLTYGMTNESVRVAQNLLRNTPYFVHSSTGFFGPITRNAVIQFQAAYGIDQVGYIGPKTRETLNNVGCK